MAAIRKQKLEAAIAAYEQTNEATDIYNPAGVDSQILRMLRNFSRDDAGLAIHGSNTENVLTANAVEMSCGGVWNSLAAQTEIDISGLDFYDGDGGALSAATVQKNGTTVKYILAANASDTIICCIGYAETTSLGIDPKWPLIPDGFAPFGGIKVGNDSGLDFTIGTTALDDSGITDTYYNLLQHPSVT